MGFFTEFSTHHALFQDEQLDTFDQFLSAYLESSKEICSDNHAEIRMIARSSTSSVACALACRTAELRELNISVKVIFAQMQPGESLRRWLAGEIAFSNEIVNQNMRWAKNPSLLDAHEQLILGDYLCWSGDPLRRSPERRDGLDIYDQDMKKIRMAKSSFDALWSASALLSKSQIKHLLRSHELLSDAVCDVAASQAAGDVWAPHFQFMQTTRH